MPGFESPICYESVDQAEQAVLAATRVQDNCSAAEVAADRLWPPNHEMIEDGFEFSASDNCDGELVIEHRFNSDEPTAQASGAGQTSPAPDAEILRDLDRVVQGVWVRAERSTAGDGRVYEISVTATDPCGNTSRASATVGVPPTPVQTAVDSGELIRLGPRRRPSARAGRRQQESPRRA